MKVAAEVWLTMIGLSNLVGAMLAVGLREDVQDRVDVVVSVWVVLVMLTNVAVVGILLWGMWQ